MADEDNKNIPVFPSNSSEILTNAEAWPEIETLAPETSSKPVRTSEFDKMRHTSYQARLGRRLDRISRRISDNNIRLSSHPTDMIRLKVTRDERSRDLTSRQILDWEVLPIIMPSLKDVPLRHFVREGGEIQIPSLYTIDQQTYFEMYAPVQVKLEPEDLLFRLIYDSSMPDPYIMCLQVKEQLATMGYSSINFLKYFVTFYDEAIPSKVVRILKEANARRDELGW